MLCRRQDLIAMNVFRFVLDLILPTSCSYCNAPLNESSIPHFCSTCWADFALLQGAVCPSCGRPFGSPEALAYSPDHVCGACRARPPLFDQALAVGQIEGPLREAVHQFKYRPCRALGSLLGQWMADNIRLTSDLDVVLPVPLHSTRLRQRGFNQALLLAACISKKHRIPLSCDILLRVKPTRPQVELSGEDRIKNVAGAFALRTSATVFGQKVLLIDDVFTTGATMNECAVVLKDAGAAQVTALTLARAM
jgi:ComF family protein